MDCERNFSSNFWDKMDFLRLRLLQVYDIDDERPHQWTRDEILSLIERLIADVVKSISQYDAPFLRSRNRRDWENVEYHPQMGLKIKDDANYTYTCLNRMSHKKFGLLLKMLSIVYKLVQSDEVSTKRDVYYNYPELFETQTKVNTLIDDISCMMDVPRHYLNVVATSKGFIAGDITFFDGKEIIDCSILSGGTSMPMNVDKVKNIRTSKARFILIIEKDATFQGLMDSEVTKVLPCIVVTGKGFPDVNTRMMVKRIWDELKLPTFALVDADPHGIEIMCVYRYGSMSLAYDSVNLAVPALRWIGVFPSDIKRLGIQTEHLITMTASDKSKCKDMLKRPYTKEDSKLQEQIVISFALKANIKRPSAVALQIAQYSTGPLINILLQDGHKAEIQTLSHISQSYLLNNYLLSKLKQGDWI